MTDIKKSKQNQFIFLFMGIILTGFGVYLNYGDIINNEFPMPLCYLLWA